MSDNLSPEKEGTATADRAEKTWVKFDGAESQTASAPAEKPGAVIDATPDVRVVGLPSPATAGTPRSPSLPATADQAEVGLSTIDLSETDNAVSRQPSNFKNGDVIVTLLPLNTRWAWISPAVFKPHLVPEELMARGLTLTVEDYVQAMELLTNDYRFTLYNLFYKRILVGWMCIAFTILLCLLFSGAVGLTLFGFGILWLILNATALFVCMFIKVKLNRNLERCVLSVNKILYKHKILLGIDDRGRVSCHKVNLCFIYMDPNDCIKHLRTVIAAETNRPERQEPEVNNFERSMDLNTEEIIITGASHTKHPRKLDKGECLFLRYSQRWCKEYLRKRLDWLVDFGERITVPASVARPNTPLHVASSQCPCQFIEDHLRFKPKRIEGQGCCGRFLRSFTDGGAFD